MKTHDCSQSAHRRAHAKLMTPVAPLMGSLALFNTPQLKGVAQEVEDTIVKIMQEAATG